MNLVNMSRAKQNIKKQKVQTIGCPKTMDKKEQKHKEINHRCLNTVNLKNSKRPWLYYAQGRLCLRVYCFFYVRTYSAVSYWLISS